LARRLTTILPPTTLLEALETTRIHRVAGLTGARTAWVTTRPCRAPHHTISDVGLIGGGHVPMPGDVSLAHNGSLFLDEWPEFRRHVLEVRRQPLEKDVTTIQFPVHTRFHRLSHIGIARDARLRGVRETHAPLTQRGIYTRHSRTPTITRASSQRRGMQDLPQPFDRRTRE
jgi:hypothetical protein